jgi:hypothetical protein
MTATSPNSTYKFEKRALRTSSYILDSIRQDPDKKLQLDIAAESNKNKVNPPTGGGYTKSRESIFKNTASSFD